MNPCMHINATSLLYCLGEKIGISIDLQNSIKSLSLGIISLYKGVFIPSLSYDLPLATKPFCMSTTINAGTTVRPEGKETLNIYVEQTFA